MNIDVPYAINVDVPYVRQPVGSAWCGVAASAMVLQKYGLHIELERIARDIAVTAQGAYAGSIGSYLLSKGFDVEIVFWCAKIAQYTGQRYRHWKAIRVLESITGEGIWEAFRMEMVRFVESGGCIHVKPVNHAFTELHDELRSGRPLLLQIGKGFFSKGADSDEHHLVVVKGLLDSQFVVHDPDVGPDQLYACLEYCGTAIFVKPRA